MTRSRQWSGALLVVSSVFLLGQTCSGDFFFSFTFITPDKAESTETRTVALPADAVVRITNDIGSTRVTVDPSATEATIQILRTALAGSTALAEDLLDEMTVSVTPPAGAGGALVIHAIRPPAATDDAAHFEATITEDEISVVAILGSVRVATYRLRITLPPGHRVELLQEVGEVRVVGLDEASEVVNRAGSVRSVAGEAALAVTADGGRVRFSAADFHSATNVTSSRSRVEATLGAGGPPIDLRTRAGDIDIRSF